MAESKGRSNKGSGKGSSSKSGKNSSGSSSSRQRPLRETVAEAVDQIQDLIGRPVEAVTGMEKNGNEWTITVEVVELERIPNTTDVLGKYEVTLDKDGEVTGVHRTRRYHRAEAGED
jgi:hypothetical protein